MKKILFMFGFAIALVSQSIGGILPDDTLSVYPFAYQLGDKYVLPDKMGKVLINQFDRKNYQDVVVQIDSFPLFPGFPQSFPGLCLEGGGVLCDLNQDGVFEIVYAAGHSVNAYNIDGTQAPGWPKDISPYYIEWVPSVGDIDGDGQDEIVAVGFTSQSDGNIFAWHKGGNAVTGFPINHGYSNDPPVLADLDQDGKMEIIVTKRIYPLGQICIYRGDGTVYPGWPKDLNHVPASSAAVGDIDGDGQPEIIAESYLALYAWKKNGDSIPGFPFILPNGDVNSYSAPVLADLDGDGFREIIFGTHNLSISGTVYILKKDGSLMNGWPQYVGYWIYGPPAVGYIDNDNILDIAVGDQIISTNPIDHVYAWNKDGIPLSGFPTPPINAVNNQIALADLNNDGYTDLMFDDNSTVNGFGKYLAFKYDGTPLPGWPITTIGTTFCQMPCFADLNNDGILDIVGGTKGGTPVNTRVYLWNTGFPYHSAKVTIPMWRYNIRHDGLFPQQFIGIKNPSEKIPAAYGLFQNYPNPFNPSTKIKFSIPSVGQRHAFDVRLIVYDILGREIVVLVDQRLNAGTYEISWDASNYPSGVYFYKIVTDQFTDVKKMILVK